MKYDKPYFGLILVVNVSNILQAIRRIQELNKPPKNIIFMMGDGMGVSTLAAARIYLAQTRNLTGEAAALAWESMPYAALSKVQVGIFSDSPSHVNNSL